MGARRSSLLHRTLAIIAHQPAALCSASALSCVRAFGQVPRPTDAASVRRLQQLTHIAGELVDFVLLEQIAQLKQDNMVKLMLR